ncbi:cyclin-dependent kinase inhibitor 1 [Anolis carolinensis]|uniref:cyclin-dependent kinase inhibitor 1 n=1 Tax=Anolis carolinensis TaxID=28377 RepID=UPI002F2B5DBA
MEIRPRKTNHAKKNLFGPANHDDLQQDFQSMLNEGMERATWRWNFDFLQDTPAEGLFQWEELPNHEAPTFYHTCMVEQTYQPMNRDLGKKLKMHHTGEVLKKQKPVKNVAKKKCLVGKKRRQTSLTDFCATKEIRMDMKTPVKKMALKKGAPCNGSKAQCFEKGLSKLIEHF